MEYLSKCNELDDLEDEQAKIIMNAHSIKKNINDLMLELDNIDEIIEIDDDVKVKEYMENLSSDIKFLKLNN